MATPNSLFYVFHEMGFYNCVAGAGGVSDMSVDNAFEVGFGTGITPPPEGSVAMMSEGGGSSVASNNNSRAARLMHPDLGVAGGDASVAGPLNNNNYLHKEEERVGGRVEIEGQDDALVLALMDERYPSEGLAGYEGWTIDLSQLTMAVPSFAQGTFGRLYRGTYCSENVAVKILERPVDSKNLARALLMEQQFAQEVSMLAALRHPNVVRFLGACRKPLVWCIVMEYAEGGSVRSFLNHRSRRNRTFPLKLVLQQALDIARGMQYLHSLGFIHRDLKSDNLLIAADKSIKIADFGGARIEVQADNMTPGTGTYRWMAPEMIQHRPYNHKVDVYSFGIVLWELMTGELPFQKMTAVQAAFSVVNRGLRPVIPPDCPPALANIMVQCWDANPEQRPSFSLITEMLEDARKEILTTVRRARFRYMCLATPLTSE